jgi:hypothetical protein
MIAKTLMAATLGLAMVAVAAAGPKGPTKGPNGGQMVLVEEHPIEFVVRDQEIVFYLGDHDGKPMATKGYKARALVQDGGKTVTVPLVATPPNMFVGKLAAPLGAKARVVFAGFIDGHNFQVRFVVP